MSQLTCTKCGLIFMDIEGSIEEIPLKAGGTHLKCSCPSCGAYIKFLPHSEPKIYFGKYKGKTIAELVKIDRRYCEWIISQNLGGVKLVNAIQEALRQNT